MRCRHDRDPSANLFRQDDVLGKYWHLRIEVGDGVIPPGWHATRLADMRPGDSIVVYGAGPVGSMVAYSAMIQGARKVMIVDRHPYRLKFAEQIGVIPIDDSQGDPVEQVLEQSGGPGCGQGLPVRRLPGT